MRGEPLGGCDCHHRKSVLGGKGVPSLTVARTLAFSRGQGSDKAERYSPAKLFHLSASAQSGQADYRIKWPLEGRADAEFMSTHPSLVRIPPR
jgi:hypothetical protein